MKGHSLATTSVSSLVIKFFPSSITIHWQQWFLKNACMCAKSLQRVRLFATLWTVACQASPSMGFPRQEYRSGVPLPSLSSCPTTLLNSHINSNRFFVDPWNFLHRQSLCLNIKAVLLFSSDLDNLNFVSCFISLARTQAQWIKWWWWEIALHFFLTGQVAL